jgi:hypothetical protein
MDVIDSKIKDHTENLEKIYKQRRIWLYASSIVYSGIILIIFGWDFIIEHTDRTLWRAVISFGLLISVNWWYWTMQSISTLVRSMHDEYSILTEVTTDIKQVKVILQCKSSNRETCSRCPSINECLNNKK